LFNLNHSLKQNYQEKTAEFQEFLIHLLARFYESQGKSNLGIELIENEQERQFYLMNSPKTFQLLSRLSGENLMLDYATRC